MEHFKHDSEMFPSAVMFWAGASAERAWEPLGLKYELLLQRAVCSTRFSGALYRYMSRRVTLVPFISGIKLKCEQESVHMQSIGEHLNCPATEGADTTFKFHLET